MKTAIAGLALCLMTTVAHAHSPLSSTSPQDGAVLAIAPIELSLAYAKGIRLTRVQLVDAEESAIDLDLNDYSAFDTDFILTLPVMESGQYQIEWRGLGEDGHILNGSFGFTVE